MTAFGVKRALADRIAEHQGVLTEADWNEARELARRCCLTRREKRALLNPGRFLGRTRALSRAGLKLGDIRYEEGALKAAKAFATEIGWDPSNVFPRLRPASPPTQPTPVVPPAPAPAPTPPPAPTDLAAQYREALEKALEKAHDLGTFDTWKVETGAADVTFCVEAAGQKWPALVLKTPEFVDPSPRDLVAENMTKLSEVATAAQAPRRTV